MAMQQQEDRPRWKPGPAARMHQFSYSDPAELFVSNAWRGTRHSMAYRKFETAAEAIRYAVEELPARRMIGTILEVNERRHSHNEIKALYENSAYPLRRHSRKSDHAA